MLSVDQRGKILVVKLIGEVKKEHFAESDKLLDEKIGDNEDARVLVDLRRYEGASDLSTAWQEVKLVTAHANRVAKIAVVGSLDWQKLMTALVSPFTRATERFFEPDEAQEAFDWLLE
jgi:hypothetical protein